MKAGFGTKLSVGQPVKVAETTIIETEFPRVDSASPRSSAAMQGQLFAFRAVDFI